jgi:hypothetical protein
MGNSLHKTKPKNGQHFSTSATSARNTTAISSDTVTVHASADVYFKAGTSTVTVSASDYDMHLAAGTYIELVMNGHTHVAAIRVSADGVFYINDEK